MAESKHTPGPWLVDNVEKHRITDADDRVLALLWDKKAGPLPAPQFANTSYLTDLEHEANARLIAAAPDLLEALRNLLPDAEAAAAAFGYESTPLLAARAALTKAGA